MDRDRLRQIFLKIRRINDLSVKEFDSSLDGCSATGTQFGVLRNIPPDGATMSALVQKVSCVASNMTTLIQRMERNNLVVTDKNPDDMRETFVRITEKGKSTRDEMEECYQRFLKKCYGGLSEKESGLLLKLLIRLEKLVGPQ